MNTREAVQYLKKMFTGQRGYAAVAYKDMQDGWGEKTFAWPKQARELVLWAKSIEGNVFICPALRGGRTRIKGDMVPTDWLWADVDMQAMGRQRRAEVQKRIAKIGTWVISSGTGENVHVYVKLKAVVDAREHEVLNTGLRDYLSADNKQADNSLLRLPGTYNHKPGVGGARVHAVGGHGRSVAPQTLRKASAWRNVRVGSGDGSDGPRGDWNRVDITSILRGGIKAKVRMQDDEAIGRYGSRYKAIYAVTGDLLKKGLDRDTIHSLMDAFPPGITKAEDEHGAYDIHKDVDKAIGRKTQSVSKEQDTGNTTDDQGLFSDVDPDQETDFVGESVQAELKRREIKRKADQIEAQARFLPPPDDVSWSVAQALKAPPQPQQYLINGLAGKAHNVMLIAQYKTGKTTFVVSNLARSLCDGVPFLDEFDVPTDGRIVGHWNCEMDADELLDEYIRPAEMQHPERFHVANLRGYAVNILSEYGKQWAVRWLRDRKVQVWTIDSLARLARMAGVNENDNHEMLNLLMTVDDIKVEANVQVSFLIAHTGRGEMAEGSERARAATVIDDWPDARWIMTRGKMEESGDTRFFTVEGRGVKLAQRSISFDPDTRHMSLNLGGKAMTALELAEDRVVKLVEDNPGKFNKRGLIQAVQEIMPEGSRHSAYVTKLIASVLELERIEVRPGRTAREQMHWPVEDKGMARVINFTNVKDRPARGGRTGGRSGGGESEDVAGRRGSGLAAVRREGK